MKKEGFQRLLDKVLNGDATPEEEKVVQKFSDHFYEKNSDKVFSSDQEKMEVYQELRSGIALPGNRRFGWLRIAASILVIIGLGTLTWFGLKPSTKTVTTAIGETKDVTFSDGTVVKLNALSSLEYEAPFGDGQRAVTLTGEAFFQVKNDPGRPFSVDVKGIKTTVLGTEFNVKAYPEDSVTEVSLFEGSVEVNGMGGSHKLSPRQQASFDLRKQVSEIGSFNTSAVLGWMENTIVFERTSFAEVANILNRQYGVTLTFNEPGLKQKTVTGHFKNESLEVVLIAITKATGLAYKNKGKQTYLILGPENGK